MKFEWDKNKNQSNIEKHGIDFNDADEIFEKPIAIQEDKRKNYGEKRWVALGLLRKYIVVVIYTLRIKIVRLISIRLANKKEKNLYYEKEKSNKLETFRTNDR